MSVSTVHVPIVVSEIQAVYAEIEGAGYMVGVSLRPEPTWPTPQAWEVHVIAVPKGYTKDRRTIKTSVRVPDHEIPDLTKSVYQALWQTLDECQLSGGVIPF